MQRTSPIAHDAPSTLRQWNASRVSDEVHNLPSAPPARRAPTARAERELQCQQQLPNPSHSCLEPAALYASSNASPPPAAAAILRHQSQVQLPTRHFCKLPAAEEQHNVATAVLESIVEK